MKTNVAIDLNDDERRVLSTILEGQRPLLSRNELKAAVSDFVGALLEAHSTPEGKMPTQPTRNERGLIKHLKDRGRNASFIRGALKVYRAARGRDQYQGGFPA